MGVVYSRQIHMLRPSFLVSTTDNTGDVYIFFVSTTRIQSYVFVVSSTGEEELCFLVFSTDVTDVCIFGLY